MMAELLAEMKEAFLVAQMVAWMVEKKAQLMVELTVSSLGFESVEKSVV
jgi:hypothetical protein